MKLLTRNISRLTIPFLMGFFIPVSGQIGLNAGLGVSDIGFLYKGEKVYLGYETSALSHKLPSPSYYFSASHSFVTHKRIRPCIEIQYAREGINYSTSYLFYDINYRLKIDYLKIPLLLHLNLNMKSSKNAGILIGPYFAYRLRAVRILSYHNQFEKKKMESVKPFDAGIVAGFSRDIDLANLPFRAGFRMTYSLLNMMSPIDGKLRLYNGPVKEYARNITIMFTLGYKIN